MTDQKSGQNEQVVRRIQQACRGIVFACPKVGAKYRESHSTPDAISLAHPTTMKIFIDEIDSLFRSRSSNDHEVTGMMKAEFMTCVSANESSQRS